MLWAIFFAIGIIAGQFCPNQFREWVRALAGKARDAAFWSRGAPIESTSEPTARDSRIVEVRPSPINKPINWSRAFANLAGFLWRWKWAILGLCFFILAVGWMKGCAGPFDVGKSQDTLRLEREIAQAEARLLHELNARDAEIARIAQDAALDRHRLSYLTAQGHSAIEAARPSNEIPLDPSLERAWRAGIERLRADADTDPDRADPSGSGA